MKAGRELDALIAEKVMSWKTIKNADDGAAAEVGWDFIGENPESPDGFMLVPEYSTDIAAAWEVVEKANLFTEKMLILAHDRQWIICEEVNPAGPQNIVSRADTAPHAICLAALKAVEGK